MLLRGFQLDADYRGGFVSIGNFDGVHRGHQSMIARLVERAKSESVPSVVMTFDPHPIELLRPEAAPPRLTTLQHRTELLNNLGVDFVIAFPTDRQLLALTPAEFFEIILQNELQARGVVEGPNFCFGKDRSGDVGTLQQLCGLNGVSLDVVEPVHVDGQLVSSSMIRQLISDGDIAAAVSMLGHPYRLHGTVSRGAGRGRSLGFPTANLENVSTLLPADGVYAGRVKIAGQNFPAAVNLGGNPTFQDASRKLEVHIVGFQGNLYDKPLDVDLRCRLRDVKQFADPESLRRQLQQDILNIAQHD